MWTITESATTHHYEARLDGKLKRTAPYRNTLVDYIHRNFGVIV